MNYEPSIHSRKEPIFDMDNFSDEIMTAMQNYKKIHIAYESYEYEGAVRIVKLKVDLKGFGEHSFEFLQDQILEAIGLRINKNNVVLETKLEIV